MKNIIILLSIILIAVFVRGLDVANAFIITGLLGDVSLGNPAVATTDIISTEAIYDANNLYVPTIFDINNYRLLLYLDTDQNPGTGANPISIGSTLLRPGIASNNGLTISSLIIPEPAVIVLYVTGLVGLIALRRKIFK